MGKFCLVDGWVKVSQGCEFMLANSEPVQLRPFVFKDKFPFESKFREDMARFGFRDFSIDRIPGSLQPIYDPGQKKWTPPQPTCLLHFDDVIEREIMRLGVHSCQIGGVDGISVEIMPDDDMDPVQKKALYESQGRPYYNENQKYELLVCNDKYCMNFPSSRLYKKLLSIKSVKNIEDFWEKLRSAHPRSWLQEFRDMKRFGKMRHRIFDPIDKQQSLVIGYRQADLVIKVFESLKPQAQRGFANFCYDNPIAMVNVAEEFEGLYCSENGRRVDEEQDIHLIAACTT